MKIRKSKNSDDLLAYYDEDYLIYKKDGDVTGTMTIALDLILIAMPKLYEELQQLKYKKDKLAIIKSMSQALRVIRLAILLNKKAKIRRLPFDENNANVDDDSDGVAEHATNYPIGENIP